MLILKLNSVGKRGPWEAVRMNFNCIMEIYLLVEAEMSQKLSWRDLFVQIELGVDITSLGIK